MTISVPLNRTFSNITEEVDLNEYFNGTNATIGK